MAVSNNVYMYIYIHYAILISTYPPPAEKPITLPDQRTELLITIIIAAIITVTLCSNHRYALLLCGRGQRAKTDVFHTDKDKQKG